MPFAVLGFFFIFGSIFGRFVCGWLCPFGLVQDLLHKIPLFKKRKQLPKHHILKYGKYVTLAGLVLIGSAFLFTGFAKIPAFCKFLCPSGAIYGWFNKFSLIQTRWEKEACISCGKCQNACPVNLAPEEISASAECIRCGKCVDACPANCLQFCGKNRKKTIGEQKDAECKNE